MAELTEYLSVREAAVRLGASLGTIRRWIRLGKLPRVRPGGDRLGYRVPAAAIERLLAPTPAPGRAPEGEHDNG